MSTISGGVLTTFYEWHCSDCKLTLKNREFGALELRAHTHRLQQHGPIDGQEAFGFEIERRKAEDNT